ncbi:uncharacterized protein EV420DRAFT_1768707 [Desarmillaria tabescens]|uniref:Uncharacterized protein n=1 Tax=Armillaria tabescens TaxID=1929756 RepID=A0AA39MQN9_ARMTA|nr:uncharacterized protein EV420DRAFT_1768707 [Desarmillaria tabescens]KAK0443057.1 hypothetical protein EV420DRAFT_1768707 [Desarmillaria tabescens]
MTKEGSGVEMASNKHHAIACWWATSGSFIDLRGIGDSGDKLSMEHMHEGETSYGFPSYRYPTSKPKQGASDKVLTMALSRVDLHTIQSRRFQSWASALSNLAGRVLGLPNLPRRRTTEDILRSFLHHFDTIQLPSVEDAALEDPCIKEAERRGYALDALKPYLTVGLNITASAYHHLVNVDVKVYIVFLPRSLHTSTMSTLMTLTPS